MTKREGLGGIWRDGPTGRPIGLVGRYYSDACMYVGHIRSRGPGAQAGMYMAYKDTNAPYARTYRIHLFVQFTPDASLINTRARPEP